MPQSHSRLLVHLVFSTKDRRPFLSPEVRPRVHAYFATLLRDKGCIVIAVGGVADHVHALFSLSRTMSIAEVVNILKTNSTKWVRATWHMHQQLSQFGWQSGYGAFSVSESQCDVVRGYVENQEQHHTKGGYQEEFRALLRLHRQEWDERFVWD